ncbi:MAG: exodeoxyribonuclease V subunit gamma, partial [Chloroflexi bacterium]|nr:exodeoxyribonuclease V subunit gamma [Chloroflexota bacterium]
MSDLASCYVSHRQHSPNSVMANDLFTPEQVVVPTKGMAVWLEQFLAKQGQIVVNMKFPYIRDQVNSILKEHFQSDRSFHPELFTPAVMSWR